MNMRDEIRTIVDASVTAGTPITAPLIVERAKNAKAFPALNAHLWKIPEAELAHEARVARARRLLITMHVTLPESGEVTRLLVHTAGTPGYRSIDAVVKIPNLVLTKIRQLTDDIARARLRLRAFRAALPDDIAVEIDAALEAAEARTQAALSTTQAPAVSTQ